MIVLYMQAKARCQGSKAGIHQCWDRESQGGA